jgi:hypothetical protein
MYGVARAAAQQLRMHVHTARCRYRYIVYTVVIDTAAETVEHLAPALDALYDVTIAYADYRDPKTGTLQRPNEKSLLFGQPPREVHILVQVSCCMHCITTQCIVCSYTAHSSQCTVVQCIVLAAVVKSKPMFTLCGSASTE